MATRILYLITKATQGGAQVYVRELAQAAKADGFNVAVAYGTPGRLVDQLSEDGVRGIPIPRFGRDIRIFDEFIVFFDLIRLLRRERPDIINVNSSKAGGLGALAARIVGVRSIIYTAHGWPHKEPRPAPIRLLIWLLSWVTILLSTSVIVVSGDDYGRAPVFFTRNKLRVIKNGIETFSVNNQDAARTLLIEKQPLLSKTSRWVMALGELHTNKGFDVLINAFSQLSKDHSDTSLVILGAGEEEKALQMQIKRLGLDACVHLLGFIPHGRNFLPATDLFVFPSRKEGLPFALLEAGVTALPIIASEVGGIPEVILHEKTGLLVPPENPTALADAIRDLLSNPERAHQYGTALKEHVEKEFSKERMVRETLALYKS